MPARAAWHAAQARLLLPASWWPMALVLVVFTLRCGVNVGFALHPAWRDDVIVVAGVSMLYGLVGGLFAGRALALLAFTRAAAIAADERAAVRPA